MMESTQQSGHCESSVYNVLAPIFPVFFKIVPGKRLCGALSNFADLAKYKSLPLAPQLPPPCYYRSTHSVLPQGWDHFGKETLVHGTTESRGQILGQNLDKSLKSFPHCYSQVTFTALPSDLYFFKRTQPLTVSTVQLLYTVKEKGGKPDRKPYPLLYSLRSPYRNLKSENSQDYAQKPQQNCMFMNTASVQESIARKLLVGTGSTLPHPSACMGKLLPATHREGKPKREARTVYL